MCVRVRSTLRPALPPSIIVDVTVWKKTMKFTRALKSRGWGVTALRANEASADFDLNEAITSLNAAVAREDYAEAARLKKLINAAAPSAEKAWDDIVPEWLRDRLERLSYRYPTPVQAATLRAADSARDIVVRAPTGAGKTLGYLTLLLSLAAPELSQRGEMTVASVAERPDLSPTDAFMWLAPALATLGASQSSAAAPRQPQLPQRGTPVALVVVPRPTLCEQVAGVCYSLVGGYARASRSWEPGARDSLFRFRGPKGTRVLLAPGAMPLAPDNPGLRLGYAAELKNCDVLVATPQALSTLAEHGVLEASTLRTLTCIAVDEGDEGLTPAVLRLERPAASSQC